MLSFWCFNPCFDGSGSEILNIVFLVIIPFGFNPCFDGSGSEILLLTFDLLAGVMRFNPCFDGSGSEILL